MYKFKVILPPSIEDLDKLYSLNELFSFTEKNLQEQETDITIRDIYYVEKDYKSNGNDNVEIKVGLYTIKRLQTKYCFGSESKYNFLISKSDFKLSCLEDFVASETKAKRIHHFLEEQIQSPTITEEVQKIEEEVQQVQEEVQKIEKTPKSTPKVAKNSK